MNPAVFETLNAEREGHLPPEAWVQPGIFSAAAGSNSAIILGPSGSGKTALRLHITHNAAAHALCIPWQPSLPAEQQSAQALSYAMQQQTLRACSDALLPWLLQHWSEVQAAEEWVQVSLLDFWQHYRPANYRLLLGKLRSQTAAETSPRLQTWLEQAPAYAVLEEQAPPIEAIALLTEALQALGLSGCWLLVDGVEPWLDAHSSALEAALQGLLSSLALFEQKGVTVKLFLPDALESKVLATSGVQRRRLDVLPLTWNTETLTDLVQKRLALALDQPTATLSEWFDTELLHQWLKRYGGLQPRGWLEIMRPLVNALCAQQPPRALDAAAMQNIFQQHPPRLRLDLVNRRVYLGYGEVQGIQPAGFQILALLYERHGELCEREEVYYRGHEGLPTVLRPGDSGYLYPKEYTGSLDTALWRLRQALEPNPEAPIYLLTERNKGLRLKTHG